ncbi:MAG: FkbM family methyltransferase, partial [Nitrospirota bacterium]
MNRIRNKMSVALKSFLGVERSIVSIAPDLIMDVRHNDIFGKALLKNQVPEQEVTECLLDSIQPGMTILDIGANIGYMTLICSRAAGSNGQVISFEPNPIMVRELKHNLELNGIRNVLIEPVALGENQGTLCLMLPEAGKESHSSLCTNSTFQAVGEISVSVESLDSVIARLSLKKIDLIKIDVEGAELMVFRGAEKVLREMRPLIVFESAENLAEAFGHSVFDVLTFVAS